LLHNKGAVIESHVATFLAQGKQFDDDKKNPVKHADALAAVVAPAYVQVLTPIAH
jgi:hypothetical protein